MSLLKGQKVGTLTQELGSMFEGVGELELDRIPRFVASEPHGSGVRPGDILGSDDPAKAESRPTDEELANLLEHEAALCIKDLVEDTYDDVVELEVLRAETGLKNPLVEVPPDFDWITNKTISSEITYNFCRQVARHELKRFGARLQWWLERNKFSLPESEEDNKARIAMLAAISRRENITVLAILVVLLAVVIVGSIAATLMITYLVGWKITWTLAR